MIRTKPKLIIFEGPQGSGKTTAANYISLLGYRGIRGIPFENQLRQNSEVQNWVSSLKVIEVSFRAGIPIVLDRSIWSLIVFNAQNFPKHSQLIYSLGISMYERRVNNENYCIVTIKTDPEKCFSRGESGSAFSIKTLDEAEAEAKAYSTLYERLKSEGLNVKQVLNNFETIGAFVESLNNELEIN